MSAHVGNETFLSRWARLKRSGGEKVGGKAGVSRSTAPCLPNGPASGWHSSSEAGGTAPASATKPAEPLPDLDTLSFGDDFSGFLRQEVEEGVKRMALKKLFHSAEFNVMDGLDIYIDDYTIASPIDAATIRQLAHAKDLLFGDEKVESVAAGLPANELGDTPFAAKAAATVNPPIETPTPQATPA